MSDLDATTEVPPLLDPDEVSGRTFATAFRGFDPVQVRSFLGVIADELRRLQAREDELLSLVAGAPVEGVVNEGSGGGEANVVEPPSPADAAAAIEADASAAAASMVEEARREADQLVREAKDRVAVLGAAATAEATRVLEQARVEAVRIRATAADDLKGRAEDAEATAVRKIAEAEREAAAIRVKAREESDATIEAARERGREMVAEAQAARERMLADLAKRKRAAQAQLEQLRAGRDRLLDTLKVARRSIDEMTTRFDAGDGGTSTSVPPSSGVPAAPVTTTPGALSSDARGRVVPVPAGAGEAEEPAVARPVRTRAVAIGEAPAASRPQIFAPQAHDVVDMPGTPSAPATGPPTETVVLPVSSHARSFNASTTTDPPPVPPVPVPAAPREERRSSALRILRRHRPVEPSVPPLPVGRDSHGEGVRIIGRPPGEQAPPSEPLDSRVNADVPDEPTTVAGETAANVAVTAPPEADGPGAAIDAEAMDAEAESITEPPTTKPEPDPPAPEAGLAPSEPAPSEPGPSETETEPEPEPSGPLVLEEIRPRIEDLFARIRADREAATATARDTLGLEPDPAPSSADNSSPLAEEAPPVDDVPAPPIANEAVKNGDENLLQTRDAVIEPLAAQLTKRLKRALQDEQNASLDRLRTSRGSARIEQVLARPDDQATPYRHLTGPFLEQAARAGVAVSPFGVIEVPVEDLASQLAVELSGALRSRLDAVLVNAVSEDLDLSALSERISSVYRDWKVQKVERLATHYLIAAHERGGFLARPESTPLRWIVDDDGSCPDCDDNALAGPTPRGQAFPTGQLHPPAHLGCRCLLTTTPA